MDGVGVEEIAGLPCIAAFAQIGTFVLLRPNDVLHEEGPQDGVEIHRPPDGAIIGDLRDGGQVHHLARGVVVCDVDEGLAQEEDGVGPRVDTEVVMQYPKPRVVDDLLPRSARDVVIKQ